VLGVTQTNRVIQIDILLICNRRIDLQPSVTSGVALVTFRTGQRLSQ
jgi:hypothetical protein